MAKQTQKQIRAKLHREWRKHYDTYMEIQGSRGRCAICGALPKYGRRLCIDSDHKTNKPRGLICSPCNRKLRWNYTAKWMRAAAKYLDNPPLHRH